VGAFAHPRYAGFSDRIAGAECCIPDGINDETTTSENGTVCRYRHAEQGVEDSTPWAKTVRHCAMFPDGLFA
jgi:hypothetical protein